MKRYSILALLLMFVFTASVFAYPHKYKKLQWWNNEDTVKQLNVSDTQIADINKIDEGFKVQVDGLKNKVHEQYKALAVMMNDPASTNDQLTAKHNELMTSKNELKTLKFEEKLQIREVLNDEQIIKLGEIKRERWDKHTKQCDYKKENK
ncbi:MAG: Spy/CpxP family protein refolding chaperone [Thermodesulfobacteriota bacterium]